MAYFTKDDIAVWLAVPTESQNIEFKECKKSIDSDKLNQYCCALYNEGGGRLILGVTDKPPRSIVGTQAAENPVRMAEKLFETLGFRIDISVLEFDEKRVVVFDCPGRPSGTAKSYKDVHYMRVGSQLRAMTPEHLKSIFLEGQSDWLEEFVPGEFTAEEVSDLVSLETYFERLKLPKPTSLETALSHLEQKRLVKKTENIKYRISRLCLVILAEDFREFPELESTGARLIVYDGVNKLKTKLDRDGYKGYAVGITNLVKQVMDQIPQNEVISDVIRESRTLVPAEIVRELIANALIHQDFSVRGIRVIIEIYDDRLEISNPGIPILATSRFIDSNQSRNERLARLMREMGVCEEKGSGIDRVVATCEALQLPAPDYLVKDNQTIVVVSEYKEFFKLTQEQRLNAVYQHCCLRYVFNQPMNNESARKRFDLSEERRSNVSQLIRTSADKGDIKLDSSVGNSRKNARYIPWWA